VLTEGLGCDALSVGTRCPVRGNAARGVLVLTDITKLLIASRSSGHIDRKFRLRGMFGGVRHHPGWMVSLLWLGAWMVSLIAVC